MRPFVPAIVLILSAAAVSADVQLESGPVELDDAGLDAFDCTFGAGILEQLPNGSSGLASQDDACYPFVAQAADDFTPLLPGTVYLGSVGWWGVFWNGSPVPPDAFRIEVYSDDAGAPADLLLSEVVTDYNETAGDPYGYCAYVDGVPVSAGVTYHISVAAEFCLPPQWGHATGDGNGAQGYFRSEFFGFPDWTPNDEVFGLPHDLAYVVTYVTGTLPVENTSWSAVKSLY